jgi:hypothetical protein
MRHCRYVLLAFLAISTPTVAVRAADPMAARAVVDNAIRAHGGEANLAKFPASTLKLKGTFHGLGSAATFTGETASQGPDRSKFVLETEINGEKIHLVTVLNRDRGWMKVEDETQEMDKEDLAEAKEEAYSEWLASLLPLKDKAFVLTTVREIKIDKRPALGVKVSSKDHRDTTLYFDKETGLLVKTETRVKDDSGQEVTEETFLSDYKEVQGTRQATKFNVKRDGEPYLEAEVTECKLAEKLDDKLFAKP